MYLAQVATPGTPPPPAPSWASMLQTAVPAAMQLYSQRAATKMQMERARAGLPPLPVEMYSPPIRVQGGLDRQTLMLAGLGAAGVLGMLALLAMRRPRRA